MEKFYVITFITKVNLKIIYYQTQSLILQVVRDTDLGKFMKTTGNFI